MPSFPLIASYEDLQAIVAVSQGSVNGRHRPE
jgi:hypothetical protein